MNWPTCDKCDMAVQTHDGAIAISTRDAERAEEATRSWEESHNSEPVSVAEMQSYPSPAKWLWGHQSCIPDDADYSMDANQFDSERKALDVTLHMMEKQWIPYTDWINFVRKIHLNR